MRLEPGTRVIVAGKSVLFSGALLKRRGKLRRWLVEKLDGTLQYVPVGSRAYIWDRLTWARLCVLFFNQKKAAGEWESAIGNLKRI